MNLNLIMLFAIFIIMQLFTIGWSKRSGGGRRRPSGGHSKKSQPGAYHTNNGRPLHNVHVPQNSRRPVMVNNHHHHGLTSGQRYSNGASGSQLLASGLTGAAVGAGTFALLHSAAGGHSHGQPTPLYYYGDRFQKATNGQIPRGKIVCNVTLPSNETNIIQYANSTNSSYDNSSTSIDNTTTTITQSIVYMCNLKSEQCCAGYRCCKKQKHSTKYKIWVEEAAGSWIGVLFAILSVCFVACLACCLFRCVKRVQKNYLYRRHHENHGSNYINAYMEPLPMFQQNQNMLHNPPYDVTSGPGNYHSAPPPAYANPTYLMNQQIYPWNVANSGYGGGNTGAIDFTQSSTSLIEKPVPPPMSSKKDEDHQYRQHSQQNQAGGFFHGGGGYRMDGY